MAWACFVGGRKSARVILPNFLSVSIFIKIYTDGVGGPASAEPPRPSSDY